MATLAAVLGCWTCDHFLAAKRERRLKQLTTDLAIAIERHTDLVAQMRQRLDEYENQYVLMRRFLRLAKQTRD
jgi:hypothetical protein